MPRPRPRYRRCRWTNYRSSPPSKRRHHANLSGSLREQNRFPYPANSSPSRQRPQAAGAKPVPPKDRVTRANKQARIEPGRDGFINAIQVFPYTKGALYQVYTAVGQVTDIALQAGEQLVSVSAGDTVRWIVSDTTSGNAKTARTHVLVKPTAEALTTNLIITTDRRSYHVELHSTTKTYMASVSWRYPEAEILALKRQSQAARESQAIASDIALGRLRFRYRITGNAPWKPTQVFDDGRKVYIRLPSGLAQGEAPPLFVVGDNGKPALVNYRVNANTYIVDRLFAAAELRSGSAPQRIVRIIRTDARWRSGSQ